jgi:hypothetical protein
MEMEYGPGAFFLFKYDVALSCVGNPKFHPNPSAPLGRHEQSHRATLRPRDHALGLEV